MKPGDNQPAQNSHGDPRGPGVANGTPVRVVYVEEPRGPVFRSTLRQINPTRVRLDLLGLPNSQLPPQPGDRVLLVIEGKGGFEALHANVLQIEFTPPAMILTSPVEARRADLRRAHSVNCGIPLVRGAASDGSRSKFPLEGKVVEISIGRLWIEVADSVAPGLTVQIAFHLTPEDPEIDVTGIAMATALGGGVRHRRVQIQLVAVDRPTLARILRFVRAERHAQHQRTPRRSR